jgi:type II secretory ATPase GspE/PulE/Tfp pilus assembly ATPase PilB-like protein
MLDVRVATLPTVEGESIVMRLLDKSRKPPTLQELGLSESMRDRIAELVTRPTGALLVTGPTGSGKSTTLFACLAQINRPEINIITVEDPVEYRLAGINQVQINQRAGLTFAAALRSILRSDPDVVMVGEIRDGETAKISVEAALTGHLVLSTLHTNDAPSAIPRLVDIGVQPFLVSSSMRAAIAQRLVRRLCPKCKAPAELSEYELVTLGLEASQLASAQPMKPVGCEACRGRGYKGRMGIFEMFLIDDEVRHMINNNASTIALRQRARELGMRTLREDGVRKVLAGLTTAEEVITTTMTDLA